MSFVLSISLTCGVFVHIYCMSAIIIHFRCHIQMTIRPIRAEQFLNVCQRKISEGMGMKVLPHVNLKFQSVSRILTSSVRQRCTFFGFCTSASSARVHKRDLNRSLMVMFSSRLHNEYTVRIGRLQNSKKTC